MKNPNINDKINKVVFSGGGIKGLCFLGCLRVLEQYNLIHGIDHFVGSSAGAITSYLICIGYDSKDLMDLVTEINLELMKDITSECILGYFNNFGIDTGNNIMRIMEILTTKKNLSKDITFQELYNEKKKTLVITGTNLNLKSVVYFEKEHYPNMKVLEALRISISIPYIFNVCHYEGHSYVDGSILSNYPISYFDDLEGVLGFLIESKPGDSDIKRIDEFTMAIINCLIQKDIYLNKTQYKDQTISINTNINSLNFNLSKTEKENLFNSGYQKTMEYITSHYYLFKQNPDLLTEIKKHKYHENILET